MVSSTSYATLFTLWLCYCLTMVRSNSNFQRANKMMDPRPFEMLLAHASIPRSTLLATIYHKPITKTPRDFFKSPTSTRLPDASTPKAALNPDHTNTAFTNHTTFAHADYHREMSRTPIPTRYLRIPKNISAKQHFSETSFYASEWHRIENWLDGLPKVYKVFINSIEYHHMDNQGRPILTSREEAMAFLEFLSARRAFDDVGRNVLAVPYRVYVAGESRVVWVSL